MPNHDLNVVYKQDHNDLAHTLSFHHELGYNTIALSVPIVGKLPPTLPSIPLSDLSSRIPNNIKLLTRMTLTVADTAQNHRISALQSSYDILALRPTTEKTLQLCCTSLECDLISLDFSHRIPFIIRFTTVSSALQRGIRFEICYSGGISGSADTRRNLISGATSLIRATRGRGLIISSEAKAALGVRAPADVINLAQVWGLSQERGKEAVCEEAGRVVRLASIKRTSYRGVVDVLDNGSEKSTHTTESQKGIIQHPSSISAKVSSSGQTQPSSEKQQINGAKRKASSASLGGQTKPVQEEPEKPLSRNERKRRAKKARLEGMNETVPAATTNKEPSGFDIQHESIKEAAQNKIEIAKTTK